MTKYNRPNGKLFGSSASNIGVFGSGQQGETPTTSTDPNAINTLGTHWEDGWNGAVVSQAPYTAPYVEDMNAVNYVNSYNSAYLLQRGIAEYSATEEYQKDSLCTYNGEIWMCKLDNTVGQTPAEGTYWHLQGEVPIMNDNEILVGAVGGTPTVVDTNGQGDVKASATGLNIKSGSIVNADVNASAAIDESKLNLAYSTSSLNSAISGHIGDMANPHAVTKSQVLSGNPIVNADVDASAAIEESKLALDYSTSSLNTDIGNVNTSLGNHTGNKNNPHETKISNLNDVTITNLQDGDVILYSLADGKYINQQPPGGALSTLSDTTITSPIADKSLVQYNLNDTKWENSTEVWDTIEVNDIAYVGATPQGRTIDANNNVTMLATDNRTQILNASDGFGIVLPSTGIKAGEKFTFIWTNESLWSSMTTPFVFRNPDLSANKYCWVSWFSYSFIAKVDNPSSSTDWDFDARHRISRTTSNWGSSHVTKTLSWAANGYATGVTASIVTLTRGVWSVRMNIAAPCSGNPLSDMYFITKCTNEGGTTVDLVIESSEKLAMVFSRNMQVSTSGVAGLYEKTGIYKATDKVSTLNMGYSFGTNIAESNKAFIFSLSAILLAPIVDNIT